AIRRDANVGWPKPGIGAGDDVLALDFVPGTLGLQVITADLARAGVGVQKLAPVFLRQERAFIDTHARRRAETGAEDFRHHARLLFMPMRLPGTARPVTVVSARHHVANARLLAAIVVVVRDEDVAEAV